MDAHDKMVLFMRLRRHINDSFNFADRCQNVREIRRLAKNHGLCVVVVPRKCLDHSVDRGDSEWTGSGGGQIIIRPIKEHSGVPHAVDPERGLCKGGASNLRRKEAMQIVIMPRHALTAAYLKKLTGVLRNLETYVSGQFFSIINYAAARRSAEPISTAPTESAGHRLLHRRMTAKQQMRWSPMLLSSHRVKSCASCFHTSRKATRCRRPMFNCGTGYSLIETKIVYRGGCGSVSNDERASPSGTMIGSRSA